MLCGGTKMCGAQSWCTKTVGHYTYPQHYAIGTDKERNRELSCHKTLQEKLPWWSALDGVKNEK